jgi:hypothetical protein
MGRGLHEEDIQSLNQQLQNFCPPEDDSGESKP